MLIGLTHLVDLMQQLSVHSIGGSLESFEILVEQKGLDMFRRPIVNALRILSRTRITSF